VGLKQVYRGLTGDWMVIVMIMMVVVVMMSGNSQTELWGTTVNEHKNVTALRSLPSRNYSIFQRFITI
jgi:ABC-type cobalt transport system substrate-binding protein